MRRLMLVLTFVAFAGAAYAEEQEAAAQQDEQAAASVEAGSDGSQVSKFIPSKKSDEKKLYGAKSVVMPLDWQPDGYIITDADKKVLISAGDTVTVNLGSDKVKPGTRCEIFRVVKKVKDPKNRRHLGSEVLRMGFLEITADVGDGVSSAKITSSNDPLKPGDALKIVETESK